jgi:EmrB/QacA subfamily drug resistance transporter
VSFEDAVRDPARRRWILATAAIGAFASAITFTSINVALPSLVVAFETSFAAVQWVVLGYLLATAALLPIVGRLADMLGKRVIFLAGMAIFTAGSLLTGLAPGLGWLIAFRLLHGVGSAVLTGVGLAIVTDVFPAEERGRAIGINGALLSTGIVLGPTLGGLLVEIGWRWVFLAGVPVGLLGAALAWRFVPSYRRGPAQRFDVPGAALLVAMLTAGSLAMTLGAERGYGDPWIVAGLVFAAALLPVFLRRERRTAHPILDLALFRDARLSVGLLVGLATFVSISGTIFVMPFYLEYVLDLAPRNVGLLMSVTPILLVLIAPIAGVLADRYGERVITIVGLAFALIGFSLVATLETDTTPLGFVARFAFVGLGMATFQTPNNSAIMGAAPPGRSGVAGGLLGLTRSFGQTAGIAVLGSVWVARVAARAGQPAGSDGTLAPAIAQVGGLHDMMRVVQVLILAALVLALWDLRRRVRARRAATAGAMGAD